MNTDQIYDIIIIGGGIVGLSTAYKLTIQQPKLSILILEKEKDVGIHQTGHNSGVIHSGLYYKPGSLKAINCVNGYNQLIEFAEKHNIPFDLCGKLVVATSQDEISQLNILKEKGIKNGLDGIKELDREGMLEYEPHVKGIKALYVPQTGIISYPEVVVKLKELLLKSGVRMEFKSKVSGLVNEKSINIIDSNTGNYKSKLIINCAGLYSDKIADLAIKNNIKIIPFRGEYFKLKKDKEYLVKNLIYPVPNPNFPFLGVHFTRMIGGGIEAGPNAVLAFKREGYKKTDIDLGEFFETITWPGFLKVATKYWKVGIYEMYRSFSKPSFTKALQKLIPEIREDDLEIGGSGVRAQACDKNGGLLDDFYILQDNHSIHICNAPSPAATSSLSIGETISKIAIEKLAL